MAYELDIYGAAFESGRGGLPIKAFHYLEGHRIFYGYLSGPLPTNFLQNRVHLDASAKVLDDLMGRI